MAIDLEKRLSNLENELKALKATYSIYGGLVTTYMNTYSLYTGESGAQYLRVRFTPDYRQVGNKTLVFGFYYSLMRNSQLFRNDDGFMSIQDDNGDIIINIAYLFDESTVTLTLLTPVPGTFTRIS